MAESFGLIHYDAMIREISICETLDEVKDLRDKALALQMYARQAMNIDAERRCAAVRIRAEKEAGRRIALGQLDGTVATPQTANPGGTHVVERDKGMKTLSDLRITRDQSSKWQKLAKVPDDVFENALSEVAEVPSTAGVLRKANGDTSRMNPKALWIWGRLRDFEKEMTGILPSSISDELTEGMQSDVRRIAPMMASWLNELAEEI